MAGSSTVHVDYVTINGPNTPETMSREVTTVAYLGTNDSESTATLTYTTTVPASHGSVTFTDTSGP